MLQLIIFRGFQGLGAGGIMPVVLTILGDIFTLEERARIQGWFSAVWGTSSLAGPAVGALLVETLGWRSIFFVNLPFGALGFGVLAWRYHDHERPHSTDLDLPGVGLLAIGCTSILALVSLGLDGMSTARSPFIAGHCAGRDFMVRPRRTPREQSRAAAVANHAAVDRPSNVSQRADGRGVLRR